MNNALKKICIYTAIIVGIMTSKQSIIINKESPLLREQYIKKEEEREKLEQFHTELNGTIQKYAQEAHKLMEKYRTTQDRYIQDDISWEIVYLARSLLQDTNEIYKVDEEGGLSAYLDYHMDENLEPILEINNSSNLTDNLLAIILYYAQKYDMYTLVEEKYYEEEESDEEELSNEEKTHPVTKKNAIIQIAMN
jgi:hypothetical protein